ncbi:MAG: diacylglycerol kinase family protein [Patescibacteria group bacterium]
MYVYFYDTFVGDSKFRSALARIETRLTDLGVSGKICRLSVLTSIHESVSEAIKKGADTLVAVGNDHTLTKILPLVAGTNVTLGYIPIESPNRLAVFLGIPESEKACDTLSARVIKRLDLGKANATYFLTELDVPPGNITAWINNQFSIKPRDPDQRVLICNLGWSDGRRQSDPSDGLLEVVVSGGKAAGLGKWFGKRTVDASIFPAKTVVLEGDQTMESVVVDGQTVITLPATVEVASKKLRIIVGKTRQF